jgi:hypothetical protein
MDANEVVVHEVERHRMGVVFGVLGESVRERVKRRVCIFSPYPWRVANVML